MPFVKYLFILAFILTLNACHNSGIIGEIDDLQEQIEDAIGEVPQLKTTDFSLKKDKAHRLINELSPYFEQLEGASLKVLVSLANTEKANTKFHSQLDRIEKDLHYSREQLIALKKGIKTQTISKKESEKYFEDEQLVAYRLLKSFDGERAQIDYLKDHYSEFLPKAEFLVDSIKNTH